MVITKKNIHLFTNKSGGPNLAALRWKVIIPPSFEWCTTKSEYWYGIKNNLSSPKLCFCGKPAIFYNGNKGYSENCSQTCAALNKKTQRNRNQTMLAKYGAEHTFQVDTFLQKSQETKLKKYNDKNYNNRRKSKSTCLKTYGVPSAAQSKCSRAKMKRNSRNSEAEVITKKQKTLMENYGVTSPALLMSKSQHLARGKKTAKGLVKFYQTGASRHRFLYIMHSRINNIIKIGISSEPEQRLKSIQKYFLDMTFIRCEYFVSAGEYEKHIHQLFDDYCQVQEYGVSGRTEYFSSTIISEVTQIVDDLCFPKLQ